MINYINGDEALFEDASLPRDRFGFRIANGVNTRKQDLRTANSGINLATFMIKGEETGTANTESRIKFTEKPETTGTPYCELVDGVVEIKQNGIYIIQATGIITISSASTSYILNQFLYNKDEILAKTQERDANTTDYLNLTYVGNMKSGDRITIGHLCNVAHTCKVELKLLRLS